MVTMCTTSFNFKSHDISSSGFNCGFLWILEKQRLFSNLLVFVTEIRFFILVGTEFLNIMKEFPPISVFYTYSASKLVNTDRVSITRKSLYMLGENNVSRRHDI